MPGKAPYADDEWLAKAMRDSDRGEDIQAIARLLFSRKGADDADDEPIRHFVMHVDDRCRPEDRAASLPRSSRAA
ncbi:MAG: hypothetical protein ACTHOU_09880 [Aureliella sp.]|jgi:hypothetical protein